jgi:hemoglobin
MKRDINNKEDIAAMVNAFYEKVKADDVIGYIFNDVVNVHWKKHLPVMYRFWENALFYTGTYEGNPMELHRHLHRLLPLTTDHFKRWNLLFDTTVDEMFEGKTATLAKQRAWSISTVMQIKILQQQDQVTQP